jgi:hypothetical protein
MRKISFLVILAILSSCKMHGQKIVYDLPESVTTKISQHIGQFKSDSRFIAQLSKQSDGKYIVFIIPYDFEGLENFQLIEGLINKTSRVVRVSEGLLLPLVTDEDFLFADFGSEKMKDGRVAKKKVFFTSEGYPVYFDKSGKLYEQ